MTCRSHIKSNPVGQRRKDSILLWTFCINLFNINVKILVISYLEPIRYLLRFSQTFDWDQHKSVESHLKETFKQPSYKDTILIWHDLFSSLEHIHGKFIEVFILLFVTTMSRFTPSMLPVITQFHTYTSLSLDLYLWCIHNDIPSQRRIYMYIYSRWNRYFN